MIEDRAETNRGTSWSTHYLLHDKTIMIWVEEPDGSVKVHIFTKSFNMSSHVDNAEELDEIVVDPNSDVVKAFEESIDKPIANEPQWYIPGRVAIIRDAVARLTGHTELEVSVEDVKAILNAYLDKNFDEVRKILDRIAKEPSTLENKKDLTDERIRMRLDRISRFMKWQAENDQGLYDKQYEQMLDARFAGFCALIANQDPLDAREEKEVRRSLTQARNAVHELLWKKEIEGDNSSRNTRDTEVWSKVLQFEEIGNERGRNKDSARPKGAECERCDFGALAK